jgi:aldehyde dehydrogenase (NAD+)
LPPGVINVVTGLGEVVGTELTKNADIQKIAFTGSTQIGKLVARNSLDTMKRLTLELGGKSPNIILEDADLSTAIPMAINACYLGYEDSDSFYRAFRTWEGTTPSQLRAAIRRSETTQ